ncbi:multidrug ABC transporter ATP-binding protein [Paenibacillus sp. CCS19]|uniref:ABC transporter ATP-binding protein n=1 Tax=Paenibacillus sp. CCS19 TaxID=3158387 RepID=UPI002568DBF4|nr:ABC transporter ATP-binding protein [Paenibacillus cellulosilyticus]GMK38656.1 multidrug ABC transporter ATP-binding protein [Paenibacillus cellulosilyticus]
MGENERILLLEGLTMRYGDTYAVKGIHLEIRRGEIFGLLGPNGAGKTTVIEMIVGLKKPSEGRMIMYDSVDLLSNPQVQANRIGVQLQSCEMHTELTVRETLLMFLSFANNIHLYDHFVGLTQLSEIENKRIRQLSGGQKQRLSLSLTLVKDPDLIILDEPTSGLDPQSRMNLWNIIRSLKGQGKTVLLATHYLEEVESLCDRVAIIDHGQLIALNSVQGLLAALPYRYRICVELMEKPSIEITSLCKIMDVTVTAAGTELEFQTMEMEGKLQGIIAFLNSHRLGIHSMEIKQAGLEDVILELTGRELRE